MVDPDARLSDFNSPTFTRLRDFQRSALVAAQTTNARDVAIELPTGYGKTLVGLLLAAFEMDADRSAVYLTFSRQLANQVALEAEELGLATQVMSSPLRDVGLVARRDVNRARAVGVMNYWAYLLDEPVVDPPGVLILDDAHLAESPLSSRFSLIIDGHEHEGLFRALYDLIADRAPGYAVVDDAVSGAAEPSTHTQLLSFPHVAGIVDAARQLLDEHVPAYDLRYPYQRISHALERCLWLVGPNSLQIRPIRYPLWNDPPFSESDRRVYLSATFADLTDLRRRLGVPAIERLDLGNEIAIGIPGRRHIVAFDREPNDPTVRQVRQLMTQATPRAVWFCKSRRSGNAIKADQEAAGRRVIELDREGNNLRTFKRLDNADLVLAGRYDGIDLANDEARLGIFPDAPYGIDPFDSFMSDNFPRAHFVAARVAERLTQALGRMTRSDEDWAVILLEGAEMGHLMARSDVAAWLPADLYREIEFALDRADLLPTEQAGMAVDVLATGELPPTPDYRRPQAARPTWEPRWADAEANYGDTMWTGVSDTAVAAATTLLEGIGDHTLRPWWLYLRAQAEHASYLQDGRRDRLEAALVDLEAATRAGGRTAWFARVQSAAHLIRSVLDRETPEEVSPTLATFAMSFPSQPRYVAWQRRIAEDLGSGNHSRVANAWRSIGETLGYTASIPSVIAATDVLWRSTGMSYLFELKIEHLPGSEIDRHDVNQLLGQVQAEANTGNLARGAFVSHMDRYHDGVGAAAAQLPIIPLEVVNAVWRKVTVGLDSARQAASAGHRPPPVDPPSEWLDSLLDRAQGRAATLNDLEVAWGT